MEQEQICSDSIVAQVIKTWPQTISVFLKRRTACVGCLMAPFETLMDVSKNYGIPIEALVAELIASVGVDNLSQGKL